MKSASRPIVSALRGRLYSAQAAAQKSEAKVNLPKQPITSTRLPNGAVAVSYENYQPVSRLAVVYNAGTRFETGADKGINHCIRNSAQMTSEKSSAFAITRKVEQAGGSLVCTSSRENITYSVDCLRDHVDEGWEVVNHVATGPMFHPWEIASSTGRCELDLALLNQQPNVQVIEALHTAAYRDGLGNSLYMPSHKVGSFSTEQLRSYVSSYFSLSRAAIVGIGVPHDKLVSLASKLSSPASGAGTPAAAKYHGGEQRVETLSPFVHAAVAVEGAAINSSEAAALAVLQRVMGIGPSIKYSSNLTTSKVMQAAAKGTSGPCAATCLNASYSDSGLFGFHVVAMAPDMGKVLESVLTQFRNANVTDQDVQRGKTALKASVAMELENSGSFLEIAGEHALATGQVPDLAAIMTSVDKVTTADVANVAKKVINGKPSMAAVGDLSSTPYLDQLI